MAAQPDAAPAPMEPAEAPRKPPVEASSGSVKEAPPLYMFDENGKPQAMLGWTLEDFERLREQAEARTQPDPAPRYAIESLSVTGTAKNDVAEVTVEIRVWVRDPEARVPLRLDQAIPSPDGIEYPGSGQAVLQAPANGEGYVLWIRGEPRQQHRLTLSDVVIPLVTVGEETRLQLVVPRVGSSQLSLTVPLADATAEVSEGATLLPPASPKGDKTVFTVRGLSAGAAESSSSDFELTWRGAPSQAQDLWPVLEATGELLAKVDRRSVTTEAVLTVRAPAGPFERFRVSLPEGAQLVPAGTPDYAVTLVPPEDTAGEERLVEVVRRGGKSAEPMKVRLTTRQSRAKASQGGWFELGGFEVIDAVRQSGCLGVGSDGDWQVRCVPDSGVRQIDELPDSFGESELLTGSDYLFEYFTQPFSLAVRAVEVKTHVRVQPEYQIDVEGGRARLEATLRYTIGGAKAFELEVELPGWQLDEVGPDTVVAVDEAETLVSGDDDLAREDERAEPRTQVVSIPLEQPSTGEVEVTLRAHREIKPGTESIRLDLPRPRADTVSSAPVAVWPADNVVLAPDEKSSTGLVRQQTPAAKALRESRQDALTYRAQGGDAVFVSGFEIRRQEIGVEVTTEITLSEDRADVRQTLAYAIAYEPAGELTFEVPWELSSPDVLSVTLDDNTLTPIPAANQTEGADTGRPSRLRVGLPSARIGKCELKVRYSVEVEEPVPNTSVLCEIPLAMPVEGELTGNKLYVTAPQGVEVRCRGQRWRPAEPPGGRLPWRHGLALKADQRVGSVLLGAHHEDLVATAVERAWVQTHLTQDTRRDRAVFRFTSDREELELVVPAGFDRRRVSIVLGPEDAARRETVRYQPTSVGSLRIPLADDSGQRPQWLEVEYEFAEPRSGPGGLSLELPHLAGEVWVRRLYWELVLPQNEHVVVEPDGLAAEYRWGWTGSFWGRKPLLDQVELEQWSGASRAEGGSAGASRYLFSSTTPVSRCAFRTAARWSIVLAASSVVLLAGLLLIYVPILRHPAALLVAAVVLATVASLYPGPALLTAEAGSLGLALALVAGLLHRVLGPATGGGLWREPSSSVLDRNSTQAQYRPPAAGKPPSTEAVQTQIAMPTSDPHS